MKAIANCWLVKQEPSVYSWKDFLRDGRTAWTGVRNYQARNNLRSMRTGDPVLFYHSVKEKAVVGVARVVRESYPDPSATEPGWECVDLAPVSTLAVPVELSVIKSHPLLKEIPLVKNSRLSVQPISCEAFDEIVRLGSGDEPVKRNGSTKPLNQKSGKARPASRD